MFLPGQCRGSKSHAWTSFARFFFNERSQQFPLFTEAIRFFSSAAHIVLKPTRRLAHWIPVWVNRNSNVEGQRKLYYIMIFLSKWPECLANICTSGVFVYHWLQASVDVYCTSSTSRCLRLLPATIAWPDFFRPKRTTHHALTKHLSDH